MKVFNKWSLQGIKVNDPGLRNYISLSSVIVPRTGARYAGNKFHKSRVNIIERFMNKLMIPGHKSKKHFKTSYHCTGKAGTAFRLMEQVLKIIEQKTKKNPVEVLVKALENAAPREEVITIEYGGARYPKAVECAPQRRIDITIRYMIQGSYQKSFNSKKKFVDILADELVNAAECNGNSIAIAKKYEVERQADSSR
ncbi:30S ribosomal protein S7 [Candidatus Woesearchaeota archaeon]|nr:30S ribosomal protein S7 [Candidatus Woesearchaeota archaeon]